ncbi:MAG: hypothetical protein QOF63_318 [Thermoanaerobaculia bacterium]|jgi:hypothetical protein|nr:hypothetical protein [Thermoanaerobaculia bacterium]
MRLTFGDVTIDCARRQIIRGGEDAPLSAKAFAFLELLLQHRPNAVKRAEIVDHLWPDTFVSPSNLASLAQAIRDALGDDARRPRFLKTIFSYGYAFIGDEAPAGCGGPFRLVAAASQIDLTDRETILGRRTALLASDPAISRDHARVIIEAGRAVIEDLGSKNGTFVGGRRIDAPSGLVEGDVIRIGSVDLVFRSEAHRESTLTLVSESPALPR